MMYGTVNRVAKECINELLQSHADAIRHEDFFPTTFLKTLFFYKFSQPRYKIECSAFYFILFCCGNYTSS